MAEIKAEAVKKLREATACGLMDCKRALEEASGEMGGAIDVLRKKGLAAASKKSGRSTSEGLIYSYIHPGDKVGVLLEINCETDFVARTTEFQSLSKNIAMQVAAFRPKYVSKSEVPAVVVQKEKEIIMAQIDEKKPQNIREKILEGKLEKGFYAQFCLLEQPFIKEDSKTVQDIITEAIATLGENIQLKRFACYKLGEISG